MLNTVQSLLSRGMADAYLLNILVDCTNLLLRFLLSVRTELTLAKCIHYVLHAVILDTSKFEIDIITDLKASQFTFNIHVC